MPLQQTSGAASYDAFGGGVAVVPKYIEEYFSTFLYTGNNTSQTITNGIDLATKGGLVWIKSRAGTYVREHYLYDTARGTILSLSTDTTGGNVNNSPNGVSAYNTTGFDIVGSAGSGGNGTGTTYTSWTLAKAPKFFDVVTYTGNGAGPQVINHNLGSAPGCVIVKSVSNTSVWWVWHRGNGGSTDLTGIELNSTSASTFPNAGVASDFTATTFNAGSLINVALNLNPNVNGQTYVAYLFAHNAGGFGLTGTDNVISCGSVTLNASGNATVDLGYEAQWLLIKRTNSATDGNWSMVDIIRGAPNGSNASRLYANLNNAEDPNGGSFFPTANGFYMGGIANAPYIYIAIRRGPMKVPTSGTSVLGLNARNGNGSNTTVTGGAGVTDFSIIKNRGAATNWVFASRLTANRYLSSNLTAAEVSASTAIFQPNPWDVMDGVKVGTGSSLTNQTENTYINYLFDRAPSFMDVVCYTGTGSATTFAHNLGVVPEMMIVKRRNTTGEWRVYVSSIGANDSLKLQTNEIPQGGSAFWDSTTPTASVFTVGTSADTNASGSTYINRLFATCAGVSKVGSYTGNGTTQTINCGFTTGARFVLVKRTDNTGNWATSDTARGMVSGTNPALRVNLTNAESAADFFVTTSVGFQIVNSDPTVNADGGTYIFLAIA